MATDRSASRLTILLPGLALLAGLLAVSAYRATPDGSGTSDFDDFWRTARHDVLARRTITEQHGVHNYLPFFMIAVAPLGLLPVRVAAVVFNLASIGAFAATLGMSRAWVGRKSLVIATLLVLAYAADCVVLGQTVLIVGALLAWCLRLCERGRPLAAGGALALAASIKLFPIVLAIYFVLKRRGRVLVGLAMGLLVCDVALPAVIFGPRQSVELHGAFWRRSAVGQSLLMLAAADSDKMAFSNQSLPVVLRRLLLPVDAGRHYDGKGFRVNVADWGATPIGVGSIRIMALQAIMLGILGVFTVATVAVCRKPASRLTAERQRFEYAAFVIVSMLWSPVLWTFYFSLCFLPLALMAEDVVTGRSSSTAGRFRSGLVVAGWILATPLLAWPEARAVGFHYWACVLLVPALLSAAPRKPLAIEQA